MDLEAFLLESVNDRWQVYMQQLGRCRRLPSEPSIHDLRVAARRLMAALDIVSGIFPDEGLRRARRALGKQLKGFNELRDTHVQIIQARRMARTAPILKPFVTGLAARQRQLVRETGKHLDKAPTRQIEQWMAEAGNRVHARLAGPHMDTAGRAALAGMAAQSFLTAVALRHRVSAADPASIHKLRVAFKKMRYTLESLQPFLPWVTRRMLKEMNRYQTWMGEIQDVEVLNASIRSFALHLRPGSRGSFLPVYRTLAAKREERIAAFLRSADTILHFWDHEPVPAPARHRRRTRHPRIRRR